MEPAKRTTLTFGVVTDGRQKRGKIAFFGNFGTLNTGNESTLVAVLARLRVLFPESEFWCICSYPDIVTERYGIEAVPFTTRSVRIWDREARPASRVITGLLGIAAEIAQHVRAFRSLEGTDFLVVPGTGLLTDVWGLSSWGPYNLFKWSLAARLRGCNVVFLSVGAGPVYSASGRMLVKSALSLASYRSYRDVSSKRFLAGIGFPVDGDPIYPDLVFGLPHESLAPADNRRSGNPIVGLGLMEYAGRYSVADPTEEIYARYLEALAALARSLLDEGYDIRLLLGDGDTQVIDDFKGRLRADPGSFDETRVLARPISSFQDLLSQLHETDIVVATRFHNVVLSLLLGKPVLAISFHHKVESLMQQFGLAEYCQDINEMDLAALRRQFHELASRADEVRTVVVEKVEDLRWAVEEQYDRVFVSTPETRNEGRRQPQPGRSAAARRLRTAFLDANRWIWRRLPPDVRERGAARAYGTWLHSLVSRTADREMYLGSLFLRNRPALELLRRLIAELPPSSSLKVAVLGCSIGSEVYSIAWTLRRARPDLELVIDAVDVSPDVLAIAEEGVYGPEVSEAVHESIFERLTASERREMFDWDGERGTIKAWLKEEIRWHVGDAADPELASRLGPQDVVVANNFLCHMDAQSAERCLRTLVRLARPDGYLFVSGVDLDVRTRVAVDLGWRPVSDLTTEIHDGDPLVRADWPLHWWGLEPLDRTRPDWATRYASVFQVESA